MKAILVWHKRIVCVVLRDPHKISDLRNGESAFQQCIRNISCEQRSLWSNLIADWLDGPPAVSAQ